MATLREIRNRISSIHSTQQITKAMKMVAAAKMRKAQESILAIRPYAYKLRDLIADLSATVSEDGSVPLMEKRPVEKTLFVVIAADRGLCGAFNSNIFRSLLERLHKSQKEDYALFTVGRKSYDFFNKRNYPIEDHKINFFNWLDFSDAIEISRNLVSLYNSKKYDRIEIVYNEFKSAISQLVISEQFLPFMPDEESEQDRSQVDFLYEPDKITILNEVIPKNLNVQIWRMLLESNAAEQAARMTAMENATENAQEIVDKLTIFYNRSRQASITTEITEIVSGAEALKE
jgi:F-type H+-transporting ATPase subunit gamma